MRALISSFSLCIALAAVAGCRANLPSGVFTCDDDLDCPPGQGCVGGTCALPGDGGIAVDVSAPTDTPQPDAPFDSPGGVATVRLVHAAPGRGTVALENAGAPVTSRIAFGNTSAVVSLPAGTLLRTVAGDGIVAMASLSLLAGQSYTLVYHLEGTADALAAVDQPASGAVLFNATDAQIAIPDGTDVAMRSSVALAAGDRLLVAPRAGQILAGFDRTVWPSGGLVAVLTGRVVDYGPRSPLGPHVVVGSADFAAGPQDSLPMVWLVAGTSDSGIAVCGADGSGVLVSTADSVSGPYFDLPGTVSLSRGGCMGGTGLVVDVPAGPRAVLGIVSGGGVGNAAFAVAESFDPPTGAFRFVFRNAGGLGAISIDEAGFADVPNGSTATSDRVSPVSSATLRGMVAGSRTVTGLPTGQLSFWIFAAPSTALSPRQFVAFSLNPGSQAEATRIEF